VTFVATHAPVCASQVPVWHVSVSELQSTTVPEAHVEDATSHVSAPLQALPSSQSEFFWHVHAEMSLWQPPSASSHESGEQLLPSSQATAVPTHAPAEQTSVVVHFFPSSHVVPSAAAGVEQSPVAGSHVPAT
jgi:hypothetical protein